MDDTVSIAKENLEMAEQMLWMANLALEHGHTKSFDGKIDYLDWKYKLETKIIPNIKKVIAYYEK